MTTSFLRRDYQLKDNRLLPFGWTRTGPLKADKTPYIPADYLHETFPVSVGGDPAYADGSGTSVVRYEIPLSAFTAKNVTITATLYYQSIPPYFLHDRFSQAPNWTGYATALLPDVEPADEGNSDRKLETANNERESGGCCALEFFYSRLALISNALPWAESSPALLLRPCKCRKQLTTLSSPSGFPNAHSIARA